MLYHKSQTLKITRKVGVEIRQNDPKPQLFLFVLHKPAESDIGSHGKCYDDLNILFTYYSHKLMWSL